MKTLWLDTETFSDIDLRKAGSYRYSEAVEMLLVPWAWNDEPVTVEDVSGPGEWEAFRPTLQAMIDEADEVVIQNSMFDRIQLRACSIVLPVEKIVDTMVLAFQHSLPGSLDQLCDVLQVPTDLAKIKDGKKLIQLFCKPRPKNVKLRRATRDTHAEEWQRFVEYAGLDVVSMREVRRRIPRWNDTDSERRLWQYDQISNDFGVAYDADLARAALRAFQRANGALAATTSRLTDGAVTSTTQRDRLITHLADAHGFETADLTKGTVNTHLGQEDLDPQVRELLEIRQQAAATSPAKYTSGLAAVCHDGRIRGTNQFCGAARTGRSSGRLVQLQNLPRPNLKNERIELGIEAMKLGCEHLLFDNVSELCVNAVRGALVAPSGKKLAIADLSNIEGRVCAWLAGEDWKIDAFKAFDAGVGSDLYKIAYGRSFDKQPDDVTKDERQVGKVMELALQFQGSIGAFSTMGAIYGVSLPEDVVLDIVRAWRKAHPRICSLWWDTEKAARMAIKHPGESYTVRMLTLDTREDEFGVLWLRMRLPSGRYLCYPRPEITAEYCPTCFGEGTLKWEGRDLPCHGCGGSKKNPKGGQITYEGVNQYTKKWQRLDTYGGKFIENATQATARDVFMSGLRRAMENGYQVVMQVHDELVCEVPDEPAYTHQALASMMATNPGWSVGLPLAAAGFETYRYRKD